MSQPLPEGADVLRRGAERTAAALGLLLAACEADEGPDRGQLLVLEVDGAALVVEHESADLGLVEVLTVHRRPICKRRSMRRASARSTTGVATRGVECCGKRPV